MRALLETTLLFSERQTAGSRSGKSCCSRSLPGSMTATHDRRGRSATGWFVAVYRLRTALHAPLRAASVLHDPVTRRSLTRWRWSRRARGRNADRGCYDPQKHHSRHALSVARPATTHALQTDSPWTCFKAARTWYHGSAAARSARWRGIPGRVAIKTRRSWAASRSPIRHLSTSSVVHRDLTAGQHLVVRAARRSPEGGSRYMRLGNCAARRPVAIADGKS